MEINITNTDNLALSIILSIGNKIRTNGDKYDLIIPILYHKDMDFSKEFLRSMKECELKDLNRNEYIIHDDFLEDGRNLSIEQRQAIIDTYEKITVKYNNSGATMYLRKYKEDNK